MQDPINFPCPYCHAQPGDRCRRPDDTVALKTHVARLKRADDQQFLVDELFPEQDKQYVTKTGKVLTDADIEALAAEAERGYDVSKLKKKDQLLEYAAQVKKTKKAKGKSKKKRKKGKK